MNFKMIRYVVGLILMLCGVLMLLPAAVAVIYQEKAGISLLVSAAVTFFFGLLLRFRKPRNPRIYTKDSLIAVALCWIGISIFGALPFVISGYIPNFIDAFFETVSGFTTTGSSILPEVEVLPKCLIFWRSFTHWIGGMGILVFMLALLPSTGGYQMNLMKAESPGPKVGKLVPKVQSTAMMLYRIYIILTLLQIVLLLLARMPVFDAITITFGTAGTGGFGIKNDSCASYTSMQQMIIAVFMILFGVNFNVYFLVWMGKIKDAVTSEEVWTYLSIIACSVLIITFNITGKYSGWMPAFRDALFSVASVITTTGYSTADFDRWPEISRSVLVAIMFIGACAGSTGGGMKVSRIGIVFKSLKKEIHHYLYPNNVEKIRYEGKVVEHEVLRSINVFFVTYIMIFAISVVAVSVDDFDFTTDFTAVAATLNNIGPGLGMVGPSGNFSKFSWFSKLVMCFDMLAGRLEVFPMLMLFVPKTWKKF